MFIVVQQYHDKSMIFILYHIAQMLVFELKGIAGKPYYGGKTPLIIGGTQSQVLADNMVIAASALNHYASWF